MILALSCALLFGAQDSVAQDVFVPPVPSGILKDGKVRSPKRPIPFPAANERWIRVRVGRFDVISSATELRTREIVSDIQTLASALTRSSTRFEQSTVPTTVFVFDKRRESQPYFDLLFARDRAPATGAYVRHAGGGTMFIDGSHRGRIERTAMHELVHDLLRQNESAPPLWIEEGLAEYFSSATIRKNKVLAGDPIPEHVQVLHDRVPMTAAELFAATTESNVSAVPSFYSESWAAVDWLMQLDHEKFYDFVKAVESGTPPGAALMEHYGKSVRDLETAIRWRDRLSGRVTLEGTIPEPVPAVPLDRATLLYELATFLTHVSGAERDAQRHYEEALNVAPKHARTLAALGRYEEAVAAAPDDAQVHLLYAESLLTTALGPFAGVFDATDGDAARFRKSRALAERALTLLAPDAAGERGRASGIIGTSYLVEDDLAPGISQLERARALLPNRMDFALNLYWMYLRRGDRARADALFAAAFANPPDKQTAFAARNVLLAVESDRASALAKAGKLDEAAAVVRQIAAGTPDPKTRQELEAEAVRLEGLALVNRHITLYNDAIALSNTGRTREALKLLDQLLATATDPLVLRDAKKLKAELGKRR